MAEHSAFVIAAIETTQRKEAEHIAKRRATIASLKADIWTALSGGASSDQILAIWTDLVQRHLEVPEVQIWTREISGNELILHARTGDTPTADSGSDFKFLDAETRQVGETDVPLVIQDVGGDPRFASRFQPLHERAIRGVILHPVRTSQHVIAILSVFFSKPCGPEEVVLIETVAAEMGNVLVRLLREEDLLRAKRDRDRLFHTALVGFCRLDQDQHVVAWNEGAEKILRWKAEDVLGHRVAIATEESRPLLESCFDGALLGRSTERVETTLRTQDGRTVDVAVSVAPLFDSEGNANSAWLTISDLNDRQRCKRLLQLQAKITVVMAQSPSIEEATRGLLGAVGTSLGWEVGEFWEPQAPGGLLRRSTSWHSATAPAREFDLASQQNVDEGAAEVTHQLCDTRAVHLPGFSSKREFARSELAGRCALRDALALPIEIGESERGALLFFAGEIDQPDNLLLEFLRAISEQFGQFLDFHRSKQALADARQDLLQAKKMDTVGRLVGGVAHDFNNLLTIILGYGEIVLEDHESHHGDASTRDLISEILGAGKRAAGLTRQLLAFCRKEAAEPIAINVNSHVAEMQKMIARLIGEHIELTTTLAPNAGCVQADPANIEQVVMNLAVNARDAMPDGGQLTIQTRSVESGDRELDRFSRVLPGRYLLLSVSDSGCGMNEATRLRIFEPFFTTKGQGKGVGMGLATVSEIIGQCGGQIEVESAPGRGTTFRVLLPSVAPGLAPWQVDSRPVVVSRGTETILLVEDDDRVRDVMTRGLTAQGYTVFAESDPLQALDTWKKKASEIDLLILDVMLPSIKGPELASRIMALSPSVRVLYISGYGEEEGRGSDVSTKGAAYLQKPFSTYELARKVRDVCEQ
jgi:PAS domain S-box-containing protein